MIGSQAARAAEPVDATVKHTDELSRPRDKLFAFKQNSRGLFPLMRCAHHPISPLSISLLTLAFC